MNKQEIAERIVNLKKDAILAMSSGSMFRTDSELSFRRHYTTQGLVVEQGGIYLRRTQVGFEDTDFDWCQVWPIERNGAQDFTAQEPKIKTVVTGGTVNLSLRGQVKKDGK